VREDNTKLSRDTDMAEALMGRQRRMGKALKH